MIHEDDDVYITRRGEVRFKTEDEKMQDKKAKRIKAKNVPAKKGTNERFAAKALVTSKKSRGFSTKKPPKAYLSYPL